MKPEMKKLIIANLPYLLFVYLFGKLGQTYRLAAGADLSEKLLHLADGFSLAFESAAPSFHLFDLAVGVAGAVALRLMVYCKSKNAKKYRRGVEYGSARWGGPKDIAPYIDPVFDNNIDESYGGFHLDRHSNSTCRCTYSKYSRGRENSGYADFHSFRYGGCRKKNICHGL